MAQGILRLPTEAERYAVNQIVERHKADRPDGVRRIEVEFGEDWTGYPSVYVNLFVDKALELHPKPEKIQELNRFVQAIHDEIIDSKIEFWPYSRTFIDEP